MNTVVEKQRGEGGLINFPVSGVRHREGMKCMCAMYGGEGRGI